MPAEAVIASILLVVMFSVFMGLIAYGVRQTARVRAGE